jgi:hypothetical protein
VSLSVCLEPGCPKLVNRTRCAAHERARDKARGTRQERGYDAAHDALGRDYQRRMDAGERFSCWRCDKPLGTRRNIDWQLGHDDHDRTKYRGPECPACNLATSGRISPHA